MLQGSQLGQYSIENKIGQGAFGQIFKVRAQDGRVLCAKIESSFARHKSLGLECSILKKLAGSPHFPAFVTAGRSQYFNYLIMEYAGRSLQTKLKKVSWSATLSDRINISISVVKALQDLHNRGFLHRDVKPGNIVLHKKTVRLIDFGLSRQYRDETTGEHRKQRKQPGFRGTTVYASTNAHLNKDLSRRDDMISWFYVTYELLCDRLPWHNLGKEDIMRAKKVFDVDPELCQAYPEFRVIWDHIQQLGYADAPDYDMYIGQLQALTTRLGISEREVSDSDGSHVSDDPVATGDRASCRITTVDRFNASLPRTRELWRGTANACCDVA